MPKLNYTNSRDQAGTGSYNLMLLTCDNGNTIMVFSFQLQSPEAMNCDMLWQVF